MNALLTALGWMWLVAAAVTGASAFALAAWMAWQTASSVRTQYRAAVGTLLASLLAIAWVPYALSPNQALSPDGVPRPAAPASRNAQIAPTTRVLAAPLAMPSFTAVAWPAGLVVLIGASVMAVRLAGGWFLVSRLVRRARRLDSGTLLDAIEQLRRRMGTHTTLGVRASSEVSVPLIVGCRPTLILPEDLIKEMPPETLRPLLAHEFAHVARRDYLANLLQSVCDAALFACPGAWWISTRIRETREYCCDERAVEVCGDARRYIECLTNIAALSLTRPPALALGVGGPRLASRVARLLNHDQPVRHRMARMAALAAVAVAMIGGVERAGRLAAAHLATLGNESPQAAAQEVGDLRISTAYVWKQPGSSMWFKRLIVSTEFACDYVELRNDANVSVTGVAIAAIVTLGSDQPVRIFTTDVLSVDIAPGQTAKLRPALLSFEEQVRLRPATSRIHTMCALAEIRYANGASWKVTPNPAAHDVDTALSLPPAEVSRSLISDATPPRPGYVCSDDRGGEYSVGAIVPIRNEPGTFARCVAATDEAGRTATRWVDDRPRQ